MKKGNEKIIVYVALIVGLKTKNHPDIVILENGDELENKYSKYYRNAIKQKLSDLFSYDQYWKPLTEKIKGVKKIYFSADGIYNQINLNTLRNPMTGKYLIDEVEIQRVTSTKDLLVKNKAAKTEIKSVVLFGYPNYNDGPATKSDSSRAFTIQNFPKPAEIKRDTSQRFFDGENITELPGTRREVETIKGLLQMKSITTDEYLFNEATETRIKTMGALSRLQGVFRSQVVNKRTISHMNPMIQKINPKMIDTAPIFSSMALLSKSGVTQVRLIALKMSP